MLEIFGVRIDNIDFKEAKDKINKYLESDRLHTIFTPNPEIVMRAREDDNLKRILSEGDMVTPDGIGIIYAAKINKKPLKERVTGYDMSIYMLERANKKSYTLYLLGGEEGIGEKASKNIEKEYENVKVLGYHHGFFKGSQTGNRDSEEEKKIVNEINELEPDIIFVGLGFPRQELWIDENKDRLAGKIIIGNGGVMNILAGEMERAPEIWQKLGLEWLYRLIKEPSRIKRQLILPKFMLEAIFKKNVVKYVDE